MKEKGTRITVRVRKYEKALTGHCWFSRRRKGPRPQKSRPPEKIKGTNSPPEPPGGMEPGQHLGFSPGNSTLGVLPPEKSDYKTILF